MMLLNMPQMSISIMSAEIMRRMIIDAYFPGCTNIKCQLYYRGVHDTYIVSVENSICYYKLDLHGFSKPSEMQAEICLVNHLRSQGLRVVEPIAAHDGGFVTQIDAPEGTRYGALYRSVEGVPWDNCPEPKKTETRLGYYIATMHQAWDKLEEPMDRWNIDDLSFVDGSIENLKRFGDWQPIDMKFLEEVANAIKVKIRNTLSKSRPSFGMCHGDIHTGNIYLDADGNPILYDFDFCGYGWRAYDISMHLNMIGKGVDKTAIALRERRREAFLKGYLAVMELPDADLDAIALFAPFRRIFNIGSLYPHLASTTWGYHWAIRNIQGDIEILKNWLKIYPI